MTDILWRPIIAMQVAVHRLREREDGQTTTEYAILLGFLAIAIIIALFFLRNVLRGLFSNAASSVSGAPDSEGEQTSRGRIGRDQGGGCGLAPPALHTQRISRTTRGGRRLRRRVSADGARKKKPRHAGLSRVGREGFEPSTLGLREAPEAT